MTMQPERWVEFFCTEYLDEFIREGGATVKFVVGDIAERNAIRESLALKGDERGYLFVDIETAHVKAHLIDEFFSAIARRIDWFGLADVVRERVVREAGYPVGDVSTTIASIAKKLEIEQHFVRNELHKAFTHTIFRDYAMTQEFRIAMMELCLEPMMSHYQGDGSQADLIVDWLRGDVTAAQIKRIHIYQKVARYNARDLVLSLAHWARLAGCTGMIVVLDISSYLVKARAQAAEGANFYSRAAVMDLYESLRQFMDSIDEMEGVVLLVVAGPEFLTDDDRGLRMYRALEARVAVEVRDVSRENPVSGLVRVGGGV